MQPVGHRIHKAQPAKGADTYVFFGKYLITALRIFRIWYFTRGSPLIAKGNKYVCVVS